MTEIKAILFDLDGTLRDSREVIWATTEHTLKAHGVVASREDYKHAIHHLNDVHALYPESGSLDSYHNTFRAYLETHRTDILPYKGATELIQRLHERGLRLAIVSAARTAAEVVQKYGLADYFDAVVGGNDSREHKPHPEPVFVATGRLGVRADETILVGDTIADIQAGTAAGVAATIGITHGFNDREMLQAAGADYIVDTLRELEQVITEIIQRG